MTHRDTSIQPSRLSRRVVLDRNDLFFLQAILICSLTFSMVLYLGGTLVTPPGPSFAMANTAKAIWDDTSLTSDHAQRVLDAALALSKSTQSEVWQDVFAQDSQGHLVPKHSVISSLFAAPFYGLFAELGFWICQQFFFLVLSFCFYRCVSTLSGASLPVTSLVAICLLSPALTSSFNFGHDLHGITFMIAGLCLSRSHPFLGGVVMGGAVFVRPSHILVVAPLLVAWGDLNPIGPLLRGVIGALCSLAALCLYNLYLWGSPLTTAYSHLPVLSHGKIILLQHPLGFDPHEFTRDWKGKLFGPEGIFSRYWTVASLPCAITMAIRSSYPLFYGACLLAAVLNIAYTFSYAMWDPQVSPHRFFQPSIFLCLIPFAVWAGQLETWLRTRSEFGTKAKKMNQG